MKKFYLLLVLISSCSVPTIASDTSSAEDAVVLSGPAQRLDGQHHEEEKDIQVFLDTRSKAVNMNFTLDISQPAKSGHKYLMLTTDFVGALKNSDKKPYKGYEEGCDIRERDYYKRAEEVGLSSEEAKRYYSMALQYADLREDGEYPNHDYAYSLRQAQSGRELIDILDLKVPLAYERRREKKVFSDYLPKALMLWLNEHYSQAK